MLAPHAPRPKHHPNIRWLLPLLAVALFLLTQSARAPLPLAPASSSPTEPAVDPEWPPVERIPLTTNSHSVTYQDGKSFASVISAETTHYQDINGDWHAYDTAFTNLGEHFTIEHNSVRSRAGRDRAWLSIGAQASAIHWQANALGTTSADGSFTPIATARSDSSRQAVTSADGHTLRYHGSWSDDNITEALISKRDLIEQVLIFDQAFDPSTLAVGSDTLEMQAQLQLLPGTALWANGIEQTSAFVTHDTLEVRDAAGDLAMLFDPVVAFEEADPSVRVYGSYHLEPNADGWLVKVRTPLSWWTDASRSYPAVLDPTIRVEGTGTGFGGGTAWVGGDPDHSDQPYTGGDIILGTYFGYGGNSNANPDSTYPGWNSRADGYMQFNILPGLLENSPMKIKSATLEFDAFAYAGPYWRHDSDDYPTWDTQPNTGQIGLHFLGACPDQCSGFSLHDNRVSDSETYNWDNRPLGTLVDSQTVASPPLSVISNSEPPTLSWDVTTEITNWYAGYYDQVGAAKPTFRVELQTLCGYPGPYVDAASPQSRNCANWTVPSDSITLLIEYEPMDLPVGQDVLNTPGIPTYADGVLADSYHEYHLLANSAEKWRAIAVRADHHPSKAATPAHMGFTVTSQALEGLNELGEDALNHEIAEPLFTGETAIVFVDDQATQVTNNTDLWVRVEPRDSNDWQSDPDRNYLIQHEEAQSFLINEPATGPQYGTKHERTFFLNSEKLVLLRDFYAQPKDNLTLVVEAPEGLDAYLLKPTGANNVSDAIIGNNVELLPYDNGRYELSGDVSQDGRYALAFVNNDRPTSSNNAAGAADGYIEIKVDLIRCPAYTVYTHKYDDCQPIILPPNSPSQQVEIAVGEGSETLTVHSEGGFTSNNPDSWCTQNELLGTPIIEHPGLDRFIYVVQGSVCWENGELTTSEDAGVGLTVHVDTLNGRRRGQHYRFFYGKNTELKAGDRDGETRIFSTQDAEALFSLIAKDDGTRVVIDSVFERWLDTYVPDGNLGINLHTMKVGESGLLDTKITTNVALAPYERQFDTAWELFPRQVTEFAYGQESVWDFSAEAIQDAPLPTVITDLEGMELRILDKNNKPTGIFDHFDSHIPNSALPKVDQFRAERARLTADASLGGASIDAQYVVMPPGRVLQPAGLYGLRKCEHGNALTSCFDIRRDDYNWANGNGGVSQWKLPDLHVTSTAQSMRISTPGHLSLFSGDHPNASRDDLASQDFSFDTWDANVSIAIEKCQETDTEEVTVIKGTASMDMPNVENNAGDGSGPGFKMSFKICETTLSQVSFTINFAPGGIVVGSTGVKLNYISMSVLIDPNAGYVQISFELRFASVDGVTMTSFRGEITIDTRGLFEIEAEGKFFGGVLDPVSFKLAVAWNPFDMLFEGEAKCCSGGNLISGGIRLHGWVGQGWQNRYDWLPDDNEFHFTGQIWAQLNIESGMIVDEFPFVLPPFDFSLNITIAFGEFCVANTNCQQYEWGISGTLEVLGYAVGLYVSESGVDLILGSNDHVLIDQYGGNSRMAATGRAVQALPQPVTPGNQQPHLQQTVTSSAENWPTTNWSDACVNNGNGMHTCTFELSANNGRALFVASWLNGDLEGSLITPTNSVISMTNAMQQGAVYSETITSNVRQFSFAVEAPEGQTLDGGTWQLQLTGVVDKPDPFPSHYKLMMAADIPAPSIEWVTPVSAVSPQDNGNVTLSWTAATRGGSPLTSESKMELFIVPLADKPITPTVMAGTPIANGVAANAGNYLFNMGSLASGEYAVGARIDDSSNANGTIVSWAPGSLVYNDTTPPPVPEIFGQGWLEDGRLWVNWNCNTDTPDLSGYLIEYQIPNWDPNDAPLTITRRTIPDCPQTFGPYKISLWESIALGGLRNSNWTSNQQPFSTEICVRSYDASLNVSACEALVFTIPENPTALVGAPEPVIAEQLDESNINVLWDLPPFGEPAGYIVSYEPLGCRIPGYDAAKDPKSPILVDANTFDYTFEGLTMWQMYRFSVRAYTQSGQIGPANHYDLRPIRAIDLNSDGLWDGWADLYDITGSSSDADLDGLNNLGEYNALTNPIHSDSDGDGFYDGEEAAWGTDGCDGNDLPPYHDDSKMMVAGLATPTLVASVNDLEAVAQRYTFWNAGAGELSVSAETDADWMLLDLNQEEGLTELSITINPRARLDVGSYEGEVVIVNRGSERSEAVAESVTIPVTAIISEAQEQTVPTAVSVVATDVQRSSLATVLIMASALLAALAVTAISRQRRIGQAQ